MVDVRHVLDGTAPDGGPSEGQTVVVVDELGFHHATSCAEVLAVPANPVEWLYHDLRAAGVSVERVGDCVAPRRAHAAVIDGERVGAAI